MPAGAEPGGADLVHGLRGDLLRDPALDLGLAARDLSLPRLEHLTEHHVLDLLGRHLGPLERGRDGGAAEIGGVEGREAAAQLAERRAGGTEDHGLGHLGAVSWLSAGSGHANDTGGLHCTPPMALLPSRPAGARPATRPPTPASCPSSKASPLDEPALQALVDLGEAKRGLSKVAVTHEDAPGGGRRRVLIAGLGKRDELDAEQARVAAAAVAGRARELGAVSLSWAGPGGEGVDGGARRGHAAARSTSSTASSPSATTDAAAASSRSSSSATRWTTPSSSRAACRPRPQNAARDLQNLPSNVATPSFLADARDRDRRRHDSLEVEVLGRDAIVSRGMGALAAVAQGTHVEPRLIVLRYDRAAPADRTSASWARP